MMASLTIIEILPNVDGGSHLFQNLQHKAKENGRGVEFGWIKARLGEFQKMCDFSIVIAMGEVLPVRKGG